MGRYIVKVKGPEAFESEWSGLKEYLEFTKSLENLPCICISMT